MVGFLFSTARLRQGPHSGPLSKNRSKSTRSPLIMCENRPNKNFRFPFFYFKIVCERPRWVQNHFWTLWHTPETIIWKSIFWRFSTFHEIFNAGDQFHGWHMAMPGRLWRLVKCIFWVYSFYFSESTYIGESAKKFWTKSMVAFSFSAARRRQCPPFGPLSKK